MCEFVAKLAGVSVLIRMRFDKNISKFSLFLSDEPYSYVLDVSKMSLQNERDLLNKEYPNYLFSDADVEYNIIYREISIILYQNNVIMMHGVLISMKNTGYLFTAKSGVGKSTHAKMWQETFGNEMIIVNGDKPLLKVEHGNLYGYGSPWNGKENIGVNNKVQIKAICHLARGYNRISLVDDISYGVGWLLDSIMLKNREDYYRELLSWIKHSMSGVKLYNLYCEMNHNAAIIAHNGMK